MASSVIIITCWMHYNSSQRSWLDFVWSLYLPRLAISFDHMHPFLPVYFSSSHSLLAYSAFVSVFLFFYYRPLQISKLSLSYFHLLFSKSKHNRTNAYYLLWPFYLKISFVSNTFINSSLFLRPNSFTPHIARIISLSVLLKIAISFHTNTMLYFHTT